MIRITFLKLEKAQESETCKIDTSKVREGEKIKRTSGTDYVTGKINMFLKTMKN